MLKIRLGERFWDWLWFLAFAIASSAWCITASGRLTATFDEPIDLERAMQWWRTGSHRPLLRVGAMPLPMDVATFPLYVWERWHGVQLDLIDVDVASALPWARLGTLLFWWLLLFYGRLAGRQLAGPWGGRLAVALLACEPSMLAHASLATKDIAISACLLALVYHFRTQREAAWGRRIGLPAFWYAAAVLAKASGLVFGPLCLLAVEIERLSRSGAFPKYAAQGGSTESEDRRGIRTLLRDGWAQLQPFRRDVRQILALGLVLVFVYCGSDWQNEATFVVWAKGLPDSHIGRSMVWIAEHLPIFSNAGEGLIKQVTHNIRGHGAYLLGQTDPRALWYYYPVVLTIKLSLVVVLTPIFLLLIRPRALANWACVAAAVLVLFSLTCRVQLGIRLMLPLAALAIVGLAAALVESGKSFGPGWRRGLLTIAGGAGLAWSALACAGAWPDGLRYVNDLWGGTAEGYRLVSDSNYDWGQGIKELAQWQKRQGLPALDVWYYGADPRSRKPPFRPLFLQSLPIKGPEDVLAQLNGHVVAASTTLLYGSIISPAQKNAAEFLRACTPVARTRTFLIYDFTSSPDEAIHRDVAAARHQVQTGHLMSRVATDKFTSEERRARAPGR
jgi:hypothetical protein